MSRVRSLATLTAVVALTGCYSYRLVPLAGIEPKNAVRVTTRDGHRPDLGDVTVDADSVRGHLINQRWPWSRRGTVAFAVAAVTKVEVRRLDVRRSVWAAVGVAALVGGTAWIIVTNWDDWWSWSW